MAFYKFGQNDIFNNVLEAHPKTEFLIHDRKIYFNGQVPETSSYSTESDDYIKHIPSGYLSLYEINIDRQKSLHTSENETMVYPFVIKDSTMNSLGFNNRFSISATEFNAFDVGAKITGSYPASTTIAVERYVVSGDNIDYCNTFPSHPGVVNLSGVTIYPKDTTTRPSMSALKNTLNRYKHLSDFYDFSNFDDTKEVNLVSIPSLFYGSSIEKGSVSLKYYITGSLAGELQDTKRNGELIQVSGEEDDNGKIAGVVLYNEGFVLLTGDWELDDNVASKERYNWCPTAVDGTVDQCDFPRWKYWGQLGDINDFDNGGTGCGESGVPSASFYMSFNGTNYIPTVTMLAHAKKGELNNSTNPTFLTYNQDNAILSNEGSLYAENSELTIKNTVKSPYDGYEATFQKQTWISQIGIYDEDKNLIAVAKLANPVRKTEDREFTFKLKLDI